MTYSIPSKHYQCFILLLSLFISACTPTSRMTILQPAELDTSGIRVVAVGPFEIAHIQQHYDSERAGTWKQIDAPMSTEQQQLISRAIRAQVVSMLTNTPYFKVHYTDEFAALENDKNLQQTISVKGYKVKKVDAVLSAKVWIDLRRTDATDLGKIDMQYVQGHDNGLDVEVQRLVWWPYKSTQGSLAMQLKLTQLNPQRVIASDFAERHTSQKLGGAPAAVLDQISSGLQGFSKEKTKASENKVEGSAEVIPSFEQLTADLAASIAAAFVKKIAITEKEVAYPIATGGDKQGQLLLQASAYDMAIEHLQRITEKDANPDDLYNLALCFEAKGDYGLANNLYEEALSKVPGHDLYTQGLTRVEIMMQNYPRLRKQLQGL